MLDRYSTCVPTINCGLVLDSPIMEVPSVAMMTIQFVMNELPQHSVSNVIFLGLIQAVDVLVGIQNYEHLVLQLYICPYVCFHLFNSFSNENLTYSYLSYLLAYLCYICPLCMYHDNYCWSANNVIHS